MNSPWEFWIDVRGTFTDCLGRSPKGSQHSYKLLSTGVVRGEVGDWLSPSRFIDAARRGDPEGFWNNWRLRLFDETGATLYASRVVQFARRIGAFTLAAVLPPELPETVTYELA